MTILQKLLPRGAGRWRRLGRAEQAVRHTEVWEHETFAEEQARWERNDPEYARICEQVRQARQTDGEALRRAHEAKAEWDARQSMQRQATDAVERAHHLIGTHEAHRNEPAKVEVE